MKINWNNLAANILKSELTLRGLDYDQLQKKLAALGIHETTTALKAKINRGAFQFSFFLQCAAAIGIKNLPLDKLISEE